MRKITTLSTRSSHFKNYGQRVLFLLMMILFLQHSSAFSVNGVDESKDIAQSNVTVKGRISDEGGEPITGVTIFIKGTQTATVSDIDGNYSIQVPNRDITLMFRMISYHVQEIALKGRSEINVILEEDIQTLKDVVVVGYGTLKRSDIATSVVSVKPENFNAGGARDPMSLLEGKVAGLQITRTGGSNPNSGVAYQLRGVVSMTGSKSPLVVIDGIPDGNMDLIQPEDIESIEVLKDGSAAAIYGSRGNAGVILVTTKKGKIGSNIVEYSTFFTKHVATKRPRFLKADEYRAMMNDPDNPDAGKMTDYGSSSDFYDALMNDGNLSMSHNLSLSGGTDKTVYRGSLFYNNYEGIGRANNRKNYGARISLGGTAYDDMLTMQVNAATNFNNANMVGGGSWETANKLNPTLALDQEIEKSINPINRLKNHRNKRNQQTTSISGKVGLEPIKGLKFDITGTIQRNEWVDSEYINVNSWESHESHEDLGFAKKETELDIKGTVEPTVSYSAMFNDKHSINALAGYSFQYNVWEKHGAENKGFMNDALQENDLGAGSWLIAGKANMWSEKKEDKLIAFFGRVNYSYDNRYVAQFSLRHEGSTKFGANHKWGNFPSYSVAWNSHNESFMKEFSALTLLKVRLGYGVTGNSGIDRYMSIVQLGTGGFYLTPDGKWSQSYGPASNPNPNLKWEKKEEWNLGLDFGFLKNRIGGSLEFFNRTTKDLLEFYNTQQPPYIFNSIFANVGDITSKGVEATLNLIPVATKDFTWRADITASTALNKVKSFSNDLYEINYKEYGDIGGYGAMGNAIRTYAGDKIGNFYGKRFAGFDENGDWLFYTKDNEKVAADKITDQDLGVIGNGAPKFHLNWSNTFIYRDFDLTLMFRSKWGFQVLNRMEMAYGNLVSLPTNILKGSTINSSYQYSDYYIENGNFVKLDNITVGYNFRKKSQSSKIPEFRVYATARDLLTITNFKGLDPETNDTGLDPGLASRDTAPRLTSITLGLNVKF